MRNRYGRTGRTQRFGSGLLALALLGASCAGSNEVPGNGDAVPTTSSTEAVGASATSTTVPAEEAVVVAAYEDFWDAYLEAADPMDPSHPVLAEHAVNPQLERLQKSFLSRRSSGEVIRGTLDLAPEVVSVNGGTARLRDCYADSTGVYDVETGERKDTPTGVRHRVTAEMVLDGAVWKVGDITREGDGCDRPA
jgi:hypothetical protein